MANKRLIAVVVSGLFANAPALAADDPFYWSGEAGLGYRWSNVDGGQRNGAYGTSATTLAPFTGPADEAKANEYRDLRDSVIGVFDVRGASRSYWFSGFGDQLGLDDQFVDLRGGAWNSWRGQFYWDKIPHNLSWNALSPLSDPTSTRQNAPAGAYPPAQNPALWNGFNYGLQRDTIGGNVEASFRSPWFVRADYNEVTTTGVRPSSGQLGTGSGNGLIEIGLPVEYKTKNATFEAGYADKMWSVKLGYLNSKFSSAVDTVQWANFYLRNGLDELYGPPDSELSKWSLNASVRQLPLDTTIAARFTRSELTNSVDVLASGLKPASNIAPPPAVGYLVTAPSRSTFDGEHTTTSASISIASTPWRALETRLYYDYYDKDNGSTPIDYAAGGLGPGAATCPPTGGSNNATRYCLGAEVAGEPFAYTKNTYGLDVTWRFAPRQRLLFGANWLSIDRDSEIAQESDEDRYFVEYRNTMAQGISGRLKYQYMQRRSDINHLRTPSGNANLNTVAYFYSAYDVANFDQNMVKANIDFNPMDRLTIGVGGTWKKTNYKDLQYYGRTDDTTTLVDLNVAYGTPDKWQVSAIANWGLVEFNQAYHQGTGPFPNGTQTPTDFDWGTENTQDYWLVGVSGDWMVTPQLKLTASASYMKTSGGVDFWSGNYAGTGGYLGGPLVNYVTDNTKTTRFQIKGDYAFNKNWSATFGYAYEKYDYADDQMRGYQGYYPYYQNLGSTNNSWFTGAYANPSYDANIVWVMFKYRFDTIPAYVAPAVAAVAAPAPAAAPAAKPAPAPAAAPAPAPKPPAAPMDAPVTKITLQSKALFDFDKAVLTPAGSAAIDAEVIAKLPQVTKLDLVLVSGHTDRLGSDVYNQKLSERRADAVRDYLVSKGVPKGKVETIGMGEKQPVTGNACQQKNRKELIACLQPDRRVEVEVKGEAVKK